MKRILVAYATMAGSTAEVAQAVGEEIAKHRRAGGRPADQRRSRAWTATMAWWSAAPMIMGWHREALGFLKKHRQDWQRIPLAVFVTGDEPDADQ